MGQEGIKEGGDNEAGIVGGSHWCEHKREGIECTPAQTKPPWLSCALGVANSSLCGPEGS